MGIVALNSSGIGGAQSGTATGATTRVLVANDSDATVTCDITTGGSTVEQSDITVQKKDFTIITGLTSAVKTLTSVKTSHGTSAQDGEKLYIYSAT